MGEERLFSLQSMTDEELVKLAQSGNRKALNVLTARFQLQKKAVQAGYLDGDDLAQEGMFGFLSAVKSYSPDKNVPFGAYARICINNSINSAARRTLNDLPVDNGADPIEVESTEKNPLDSVVESENLTAVLISCEKVLSNVEKSVVFCRMSGLSYTETAAKLGITEKAADNALQRARKKLKEVFA